MSMKLHLFEGATKPSNDVAQVLVTKVGFLWEWFGSRKPCGIESNLLLAMVASSAADSIHAAWLRRPLLQRFARFRKKLQ